MQQVLFLCSGNYYRSRFAEHLFNWLAPQAGLPWRAESRGLLVESSNNVGPISRYAAEALKARCIPINSNHRYPIALHRSDLVSAGLVVAVKQAEHRRLMNDQFPDWAAKIEYWHVDDLDCAEPAIALPLLEEKVRILVARLQAAMESKRAEVA